MNETFNRIEYIKITFSTILNIVIQVIHVATNSTIILEGHNKNLEDTQIPELFKHLIIKNKELYFND